MKEFRVTTDRGKMRISANTQSEAEQIATHDGYRILRIWEDCSFREAIAHAQGRKLCDDNQPDGLEADFDCLVFTDGTAIAVRSTYEGPYSEVTPDVSAGDPTWKVYR